MINYQTMTQFSNDQMTKNILFFLLFWSLDHLVISICLSACGRSHQRREKLVIGN